jgi:hypothetical protein
MKTTFKIIATIFIVLFPPALAWHTFVHPLISYFDARDWIQTETDTLTVRAEQSRGKTHTIVEYTFDHPNGKTAGDAVQFWPGSFRNTIDPRLQDVTMTTVWYDPMTPRRCVLFKDIDWGGFAFGMIPCVFSVLSFWILFGLLSVAFRTINEEAEQDAPSNGG